MKPRIAVAALVLFLAITAALWVATRPGADAALAAPVARRAVTDTGPPASPEPETAETAVTDNRPGNGAVPKSAVMSRESDVVHHVVLEGKSGSSASAPPPPPPAEPGAGDPGVLDKDAIRTAIRAVIPLVRDCYAKELARTPDAHGTLKVRFDIVAKNGRGRIDEANVGEDSTLNGYDLQSCVLGELSKADFPMPSGDGQVFVTYPFVFKPAE